jgi:molecular chaperone GrpE
MTDQEPIDIAVEQELEQESPVESSEEELEGAEPQEEVSELERLQEELAQAQAKADEYLDGWQRARAEFANYRRREEARREQSAGEIAARVLGHFVPVLDDLDRAFSSVPPEVRDSPWVQGLALVAH